ncbi:MAG: helix-turn-helix domain-containing protein [Sulfitobacter sp.]
MPPKQLSSCIAAAIVRDTRGAALTDDDRFNCFPSTPLVSVTRIVEGELRLVDTIGNLEAARSSRPLPSLSVLRPHDCPTISWSPAGVYAITLGLYPDAWVKLGVSSKEGIAPEDLEAILGVFSADHDPVSGWDRICRALITLWEAKRHAGGMPDWPGSDLLSDWSRHLFSRIAMTAPGKSVRTIERRLRRWTGRTAQQLDHFSAMEDLHRRMVEDPDLSLVELANDAGFADQSHMGRAVRRSTGFSPAQLNQLIRTHEAFWCYRLLGERF